MLVENHLGELPIVGKQRRSLVETTDEDGDLCQEMVKDQHQVNASNSDEEYWRPSYMFHWLKHVGGSIGEAYKHFGQYYVRQSYLELKLETPTTMQREENDDNWSEWSHMSDYDATGVARTIGGSQQYKHHEDSSIRTANAYDETDDACRREWRSEQPKGRCHKDMVCTTDNTTRGEMDHVSIRDEIEPKEELEVVTAIKEKDTQTNNGQGIPDNRAQQHNHVKEIHDEVGVKEIWNHIGQAHCVKEWQVDDDAQLACFTKGQRVQRAIGSKAEEDEYNEGAENMMCQMTGEQ